MGQSESLESLSGNKKPPPSAIKNTNFKADRDIILPEEYKDTKKDICKFIRDLYDYEQNDSIQPAINLHCDLGGIENSIFEHLKNSETHFTVRLYISSQLPKNFLFGLYAKVKMEVGTNHLGVQICDKIVHWFSNSLVSITEFSGKNAVAIFPPHIKGEECLKIENTKENRLKICKLIQEWNCTKVYSVTKENCQLFATSLFSCLGLDCNFSEGIFGEFIKYISSANNSQSTPCLVEKGKKTLEWKNHYELDEWTKENSEQITSDRNLYLLVKGFHRAYQARMFAFDKDENTEKSDGDEVGFGECPMGNPTGLDSKAERKNEGNNGSGGSVDNSSSSRFESHN